MEFVDYEASDGVRMTFNRYWMCISLRHVVSLPLWVVLFV